MHIKNLLGRRGAAVVVTLLLAIGLSSCGFARHVVHATGRPLHQVAVQRGSTTTGR